MTYPNRLLSILFIVAVQALISSSSWAATLPTAELTLHNGTLTPSNVEVPANTRFKLVLHNTGNSPAEFESKRLRQEKVLSPGVTSFVVIYPLKPGEYEFIDEFHLPQAKGMIIAK